MIKFGIIRNLFFNLKSACHDPGVINQSSLIELQFYYKNFEYRSTNDDLGFFRTINRNAKYTEEHEFSQKVILIFSVIFRVFLRIQRSCIFSIKSKIINFFSSPRNLFPIFSSILYANLKKLSMRKIILICFIWLAGTLFVSAQNKQETGINSETATITKKTNYSFKGYYNVTDMGFLIGSTDNMNIAPFSILMVNGYQFTENFGAGVGLGVEFFSESYLPLVLDARYYFRKANFSPFVFVHGGYLFALESDANQNIVYDHYYMWPSYIPSHRKVNPKGGWMINPGLGIRNMFNEHLGFTFSVGYRFQSLQYKYNDDSQLFQNFNRLDLKIGFIFN